MEQKKTFNKSILSLVFLCSFYQKVYFHYRTGHTFYIPEFCRKLKYLLYYFWNNRIHYRSLPILRKIVIPKDCYIYEMLPLRLLYLPFGSKISSEIFSVMSYNSRARQTRMIHGLLAQLGERMGHNHDVAGSSPSQTTI